jgi:two-component system cell cycle response regulator CpdR
VARVLVAEDEEAVRSLVVRAIEMDHHIVTAVADGAAALDVLSQDNGQFDLLLTDIKMPIMDGIALALAVARDYPAVRTLLMTGYADQRERASGLEGLVQGIIAKPFTVAELRFAVAAALAQSK